MEIATTYTFKDQIDAEGKVVDKIATITRTECTEYKEEKSITELKNKVWELETEKKRQELILTKINEQITELNTIINEAKI